MDARKAIAVALNIFAFIMRICAIALCIIIVLLCIPGAVSALGLVGFVVDLSHALPSIIAGYGVIVSPFGGVFRFDYLIMALLLFLIDWICVRLARRLRYRKN